MKITSVLFAGLLLAGCATSQQPATAQTPLQLYIPSGGIFSSMLAPDLAIPGAPTVTTPSCGTSTRIVNEAYVSSCASGGSTTITSGSTATSGFANGTIAFSNGSTIQSGVVGSGLLLSGGVLSATGSGSGTVTVTGGTPATGHCAQFSGPTSITDAGAVCSGGGGSGTINAGTPGQIAFYSGTTTISGTNILPTSAGGTGTNAPSLISGSGITITGSFPNQTVSYTGGGGGGGSPGVTAVSSFCGSGTISNAQTCINAAMASAVSTNNLVVQMDCSTYNTTGSIIVPAQKITFQGLGQCTQINGTGSFDTVQVNAASTHQGDWYGNHLGAFTMNEGGKSSGFSVNAAGMSLATFYDIHISSAPCGVRIHDVNNFIMKAWTVSNTTGSGCQAILLSGGGSGESAGDQRTDVIDMYDIVVDAASATTGAHHGIIIDGDTNTISAHKVYLTSVDGHGLWIRNSISAVENPQFGSIYGLESDFDYGNAIVVEHGSEFNFTDAQVNGSKNGSNINLQSDSHKITFTGGLSSGACSTGADIAGNFIIFNGMKIMDNSTCAHGGSPGIHIFGGVGAVSVIGNVIGGVNAGWQSNGILIDSGANYFTVAVNTCFNNASACVQNNAGTSATQVVIAGAQ